jgi:hypothetical protein
MKKTVFYSCWKGIICTPAPGFESQFTAIILVFLSVEPISSL